MGDTTPAIGEALQQRALPFVHCSSPLAQVPPDVQS
jgi:hypothetical protein